MRGSQDRHEQDMNPHRDNNESIFVRLYNKRELYIITEGFIKLDY